MDTMTSGTDEVNISALVCRPVHWLDDWHGFDYQTPNPHMTLLWVPDGGLSRELFLAAVRLAAENASGGREMRKYRTAKLKGTNAFGPDKTYPVFELEPDKGAPYSWISGEFRVTKDALVAYGYEPDFTYTYSPHVTTSVVGIVNPPKRVLLGPVEVWWHGEERIVV